MSQVPNFVKQDWVVNSSCFSLATLYDNSKPLCGGGTQLSSALYNLICLIFLLQQMCCLRWAHPPQWPHRQCNGPIFRSLAKIYRHTHEHGQKVTYIARLSLLKIKLNWISKTLLKHNVVPEIYNFSSKETSETHLKYRPHCRQISCTRNFYISGSQIVLPM